MDVASAGLAADLPEWSVTLIIVMALAGLPLSIVLAWAFDITPDGVRRTPPRRRASAHGARREAGPAASARQHGLVYAGAFVLLVVVGFSAGTRLLPRSDDAAAATANALDAAIAVLPFTDLSPAGDQQYFADGMTEDILARLSTVGELHVISRMSAMQYRGTTKSLRQIGEELGVGRVLAGSVRRAGDRVRIVAQLVDARSDRQLWAETYDRELTDIFAVQSAIAEQIASALRVRLTPEVRQRLGHTGTTSIEAYDLYLHGREYFNRSYLSPEELHANVAAAQTFFRRALETDPGYALAHAGLSEAFLQTSARDSAEAHARRAIALAPALPDGYVALARALRVTQPESALANLNRAIALDANHAQAIAAKATLDRESGHLDQAVAGFLRAAALDPGYADHARSVAAVYRLLGDPDAAATWNERAYAAVPHAGRRAAELAWLAFDRGDRMTGLEHTRALLQHEPDGPIARANAVELYIYAGEYDAARRIREQRPLYDDQLFTATEFAIRHRVLLSLLERRTGRATEADELRRRAEASVLALLERSGPSPGRLALLAMVRAHQNEADDAVRLLGDAVELGWRAYYTTRNLPDYSPLAGHAGFESLMARVRADVDAMRTRAGRNG